MSSDFEQIADYPTLSDSQRIQARNNARRNIIAKHARKPERSAFDNVTAAKFPPWFTWGVGSILLAVAISAGYISAVRLYYAGYNAFYQSIQNEMQAVIVGLLTPFSSELLVIIAAVSTQVYLHQRGNVKVIALVPVAVGTAVAFVGNWQITQPSTTWGWVETFYPPVAVLAVAFFFELALMPELERRQADESAYRDALADYDTLMNRPEDHREWRDTYGAALWEMWSKVYQRDLVDWMIDRETKQLIALREMGYDAFFSDDISGNFQKLQKASPKATVSQAEVIAYITANPDAQDLKQSEIADVTGASPATVSRAFQKLHRNGHGQTDQERDA